MQMIGEAEAKQAYQPDERLQEAALHPLPPCKGLVSYRNGNNRTASPYMPLDFDDLESEDGRDLQQRLMNDKYIDVAISFTSRQRAAAPAKAIVVLPPWAEGKKYQEQFRLMEHYMSFHYGYAIDKSGKGCQPSMLPFTTTDPYCMKH